MESQKCVECDLLNWADQELCKRCQTPLRKLNGSPNLKKRQPIDAPTLFTFNGIGTRLLGWKHYDDGTSTTSVWFTLLFFPLFPMSRHRVITPSREDFKQQITGTRVLLALASIYSISTTYRFLGRLPLSGKEILKTYFIAYIGLPITLLAPLALIGFAMNMSRSGVDDGSTMPMLVGGVLSMIWLGYVFFVAGRVIHRTRGGVN